MKPRTVACEAHELEIYGQKNESFASQNTPPPENPVAWQLDCAGRRVGESNGDGSKTS